jgi:hypothetical protein
MAARDRAGDAHAADQDKPAPRQSLMDGPFDGRPHDLVHGDRLRAPREGVTLNRDVTPGSSGGNAVLYDRKHNKRSESGDHQNRPRAQSH